MSFPDVSGLYTVLSNPGKVLDDSFHLKLAADWLLESQRVSGGTGYSHSYSLLSGWKPPYPETSGYIISSMFSAFDMLEDPKYKNSAISAGEWILSIQNSDGSFSDLHGRPQVFDTGQIIYGLLELYSREKKAEYLDSAAKAGKWLCSVQENDGSWIRFSYNQIPHTYYSRVGSILLALSKETEDKYFWKSGMKNLDWVVSQQDESGYFSNMAFDSKSDPYLHTIVYVLEGLFHGFQLSGNKKLMKSVFVSSEKLNSLYSSEKTLFSQYSKGWVPANREQCVTGLAQWAGLTSELSQVSGESQYLKNARSTLDYLKAVQITSGSANILGALPSSIPVWGRYGRFSFFNWNAKFFIDAIVKYSKASEVEK
jgi:uncharacterized protein YyaL (SSP411 family)